MPNSKKLSELLELAWKRQASRWNGYSCIGDYHGGAYECDFVSPYTKTAGNVDADYFVMLQDWSSDESLSGPFDEPSAVLGHTPSLPTNRNLRRLLRATFGVDLESTYGTNLFPFVKLGPMSARIPRRDLVRAAIEFGLPQVRIVRPRVVICLGVATYAAVRAASGLPPVQGLAASIEAPFDCDGIRVWCQAHTGALGQNNRNRGGANRTSADWMRMKADVREPPG